MLTPKRLAAALRDSPPKTTASTTRLRRSSESAIPAASFPRQESSIRIHPIRESPSRFSPFGYRYSIHPYSTYALAAMGRAPTFQAGRESADRPQLGARDQVRRLSDGRPDRTRQGPTPHPVGTRLDRKVSGHDCRLRQALGDDRLHRWRALRRPRRRRDFFRADAAVRRCRRWVPVVQTSPPQPAPTKVRATLQALRRQWSRPPCSQRRSSVLTHPLSSLLLTAGTPAGPGEPPPHSRSWQVGLILCLCCGGLRPNMRRRSDAAATDFCVLRDYFRHELRRIGDGARVGLLLWRSWIDRSASQPPDGIAGKSPQS